MNTFADQHGTTEDDRAALGASSTASPWLRLLALHPIQPAGATARYRLILPRASGDEVAVSVPAEGFWDEAETYYADGIERDAAAHVLRQYRVRRRAQVDGNPLAQPITSDYTNRPDRAKAVAAALTTDALALAGVAQDIAERLTVAVQLGTKWNNRYIALHVVASLLDAVRSADAGKTLYELLAGRPPVEADPLAGGWPAALAAIQSRSEPPELGPGHWPG